MIFKIKLVDLVFEITSIYHRVYLMCRDYVTQDEEVDVRIRITEEDIVYERSKLCDAEAPEPSYVADYLETLAVYRKIAEACMAHHILLMHGAVLSIRGAAYMITAKSGVGKTTAARILSKHDDDICIVNGDKPLISMDDHQALAWGTPWSGKERQQINCHAPLRAILLLERSDHTQIEEISFSEAMATLLQQTYKPQDTAGIVRMIGLIGQLASRLKFFRFSLEYHDDIHDIDEPSVYQQFMTRVVIGK